MLAELHVGGKLSLLFDDIEARNGGDLPPRFADRYRERQMELLAEVDPIPGVDDVISIAGERRAVASGGPMNKMRVTLGAVGFWDRFSPHIYSCYDVGEHKPAPDVYLHAAAELEVAPAACVVIEDSVPGVRAASAAGMTVIGFTRDIDARALTDAGAEVCTSEMSEVVGLLAGRGW